MKIREHIEKAQRIEKTMLKLDKYEDYETIILNSMFSGTHFMNAVLHKLKVTLENEDILHSDKPGFSQELEKDLKKALADLKVIEDLRRFVRKNDPYTNSVSDCCLDSFIKVKQFCLAAIGKNL